MIAFRDIKIDLTIHWFRDENEPMTVKKEEKIVEYQTTTHNSLTLREALQKLVSLVLD
jgi:hypothetical protein